jgi:hypothetical protein
VEKKEYAGIIKREVPDLKSASGELYKEMLEEDDWIFFLFKSRFKIPVRSEDEDELIFKKFHDFMWT